MVFAPRCVVCALFARVRNRSHGARVACAPLARTPAQPYLPSPSLPRSAGSTAHATRAQILQSGVRLRTLNRARNPNVWM